MRRVSRWFFAVACVGVFLVTAVLCVRSRYVRPAHTFLKWDSPTAFLSATFQADRIGPTLYVVSRPPIVAPAVAATAPATTQSMKFGRMRSSVDFSWNFLGFFLTLDKIERLDQRPPPLGRIVYLRIPYWFVFALTALIGARCIRGIARDRNVRRHPTACQSCGYDLRAGHDKCPECGESHVKVGASKTTNTPWAPMLHR